MNIDEYRAMVAQEAEQPTIVEGGIADVQTDESATTPIEQAVQTPPQEELTPPNGSAEETAIVVPEEIEIDGVKVPVDELRQGYLRQQDYTKKTQELARERNQTTVAKQYFDAINSDPEFAESVARRFELPYVSAEDAKYQELEKNYNTLVVEREIESLQAKYDDFNAQEVIQTAVSKGMNSLEDAYLLTRAYAPTESPALDINELTEQIRQSVLNELKSEVDTNSIIGSPSGAQPVQSSVVELSAGELKVARGMGLTPQEYSKWKNAK